MQRRGCDIHVEHGGRQQVGECSGTIAKVSVPQIRESSSWLGVVDDEHEVDQHTKCV